jgi:hypothetical protein
MEVIFMIKFEHTEVTGWIASIRGMRNPMNSWDKSDSGWRFEERPIGNSGCFYYIGPNDLELMKKLIKAGSDHSKFMRMINVTVDITAPLYWWKEFDTYKVGTVRNSCSTMHKIHAKEFTLDDFSHEHLLSQSSQDILKSIIEELNHCRSEYLFYTTKDLKSELAKEYWWQMIQLLPSSYNQRATVQLNYAVLRNMYYSRKAHKLDEWRIGFVEWVESLPYSELITMDGKVK